jgi:hypothetical protein
MAAGIFAANGNHIVSAIGSIWRKPQLSHGNPTTILSWELTEIGSESSTEWFSTIDHFITTVIRIAQLSI